MQNYDFLKRIEEAIYSVRKMRRIDGKKYKYDGH